MNDIFAYIAVLLFIADILIGVGIIPMKNDTQAVAIMTPIMLVGFIFLGMALTNQ